MNDDWRTKNKKMEFTHGLCKNKILEYEISYGTFFVPPCRLRGVSKNTCAASEHAVPWMSDLCYQ